MSKTQWRRHKRMKKDAILAMQHKDVGRPSIFDRISEGPPPGFKKENLDQGPGREINDNKLFQTPFEHARVARASSRGLLAIVEVETCNLY
ncbi:hypothetical protein JHK87_039612 [Glycine soja]|nr:hypothetical protein JHK87_039612 [Glycine soja]